MKLLKMSQGCGYKSFIFIKQITGYSFFVCLRTTGIIERGPRNGKEKLSGGGGCVNGTFLRLSE